VELIKEQPSPIIFFKSLLEFDGTNMVSLLSFDSKSMMQLLSDEFSAHFSSEYPIFYRNKFNKGSEKRQKYYFRNAIDCALIANQNRAVTAIINYLIKYQNNYISSFLFAKNLPKIL
jgi:hypothetical protein